MDIRKVIWYLLNRKNYGNLHAHMLIWIHGLPATASQYKLISESDDRLVLYTNNLIYVNLPIEYENRCVLVHFLTEN